MDEKAVVNSALGSPPVPDEMLRGPEPDVQPLLRGNFVAFSEPTAEERAKRLSAKRKRLEEGMAKLHAAEGAQHCQQCNGLVQPDHFTVIRVGDEITRLPHHVQLVSTLDPVGLVPADCEHGVEIPEDDKRRIGSGARQARSFIRSKYLDVRGRCPVCRGEDAPADLTTT